MARGEDRLNMKVRRGFSIVGDISQLKSAADRWRNLAHRHAPRTNALPPRLARWRATGWLGCAGRCGDIGGAKAAQ